MFGCCMIRAINVKSESIKNQIEMKMEMDFFYFTISINTKLSLYFYSIQGAQSANA